MQRRSGLCDPLGVPARRTGRAWVSPDRPCDVQQGQFVVGVHSTSGRTIRRTAPWPGGGRGGCKTRVGMRWNVTAWLRHSTATWLGWCSERRRPLASRPVHTAGLDLSCWQAPRPNLPLPSVCSGSTPHGGAGTNRRRIISAWQLWEAGCTVKRPHVGKVKLKVVELVYVGGGGVGWPMEMVSRCVPGRRRDICAHPSNKFDRLRARRSKSAQLIY